MEDKPSKIEEESAALEQSDADAAAHKEPAAKKPKGKKNNKPGKKVFRAHPDETIVLSAKDYDRVILPEDENDPHWDPKLKNPVPEGVIDSLADFGWDPSMAAAAIRVGEKLKIIHGKTRWRALEKANKVRAKVGLPPIEPVLHVSDEDPADDATIVRNMERNVTLNYGVQELDPMTTAEGMLRLLSAGVEERVVAKRFSKSVNDLHGYLLLTDEDKCPAPVQELLREGKISFAAALELARRSEKLSKAELIAAAEQVAKVANGGIKVTTETVKKAAGGGDEKVATKKEIKQFLLDLQSDKPTGKHGEPVAMAAIIGIEVCLGTRSIRSAEVALAKLAKGEHVKVDFKQYQDGSSQPVKGQEK